jgi:hypothetical protein
MMVKMSVSMPLRHVARIKYSATLNLVSRLR